MALQNYQYDEILRRIQKRRQNALTEASLKKDKIFVENPRLYNITFELRDLSASIAKARVLKDASEERSLREKQAELQKEKEGLLKSLSLSEKDFEPVFFCKKCKDTGFLDDKKCSCFLQEELKVLYGDSNLEKVLEKENFKTLTLDLYENSASGNKESVRSYMEKQIDKCRLFVKNFDRDPESMLFFGPTGTGKTFLSNCIARELLGTYHSVLYFSSVSLFQLLSKELQRDLEDSEREESKLLSEHLISCDLLIIDDLGTELLNAYTNSRLFYIINERLLSGRSTVISTNLDLNELRDRYSERIASRIISSYNLIPFKGEDLRIKKKLNNRI